MIRHCVNIALFCLRCRFENATTQNKTLNQTIKLNEDKISALEERYDDDIVIELLFVFPYFYCSTLQVIVSVFQDEKVARNSRLI